MLPSFDVSNLQHEFFVENRTINELAKKYNVSLTTLRKHMARQKLTLPDKHKWQRKTYRRHYENDRWSIEQIAEVYNSTPKTVWARLQETGIRRKSPHA